MRRKRRRGGAPGGAGALGAMLLLLASLTVCLARAAPQPEPEVTAGGGGPEAPTNPAPAPASDPASVPETASDAPDAPLPIPSALRVVSSSRDSIRLRWNYTSLSGRRVAGFRIFYLHHQSYKDVKTIGTSGGESPLPPSSPEALASNSVHYYELTGLGEGLKYQSFYCLQLNNLGSLVLG